MPIAMKTLEALNKTYGEELSQDEAYLAIFRKLRPGEIPRINAAKNSIFQM